MTPDSPDNRLHDFAEQMGIIWERTAGSRMAGRILGWLLVCDPAEQTAADLAEALHVSAGSISTNTRQLIQFKLVEKVARRGDRRAWYRLAPDAWVGALRAQVAEVTLMRELAMRGLHAMQDAPAARRGRLEELHELYEWFENEYPRFIEGYFEHRRRRTGKDGP